MKRTQIFFSILALLVAPSIVSAATVRVEDRFTLSAETRIEDDLYAASENIVIAGTLDEDAVLAGEFVELRGVIGADAAIVGSDIRVSGTVKDDLRVIGGNVVVSGTVSGDLFVLAGDFSLLPGSRVLGDLYVVAGSANVGGEVKGKTRIGSGELSLGGSFSSVHARAENITVLRGVAVADLFSYTSRREAVFEEGAVIARTEFDRIERQGGWGGGVFGRFFSALVLMMLALGFVIYYLFPETVDKVTMVSLHNIGREFIKGLVLLAGLPLLAALFTFTIIGLPIAVLIVSSYVAIFILAAACSGVAFGGFVESFAMKRDVHEVHWKHILFGTVGLGVITLVPIVGIIIAIFFVVVSFGSVADMLYGSLRSHL